MSLTEQTLRRLPKIKAGLLEGKTSEEIALICNVRRETIERDKHAFRQSGQFEDWLREEWQRLHYIILDENPTEAYRQLSRLLGLTLTRRIEATTELKAAIIVKMWKPEDEPAE